jgi:hypothetical protein
MSIRYPPKNGETAKKLYMYYFLKYKAQKKEAA